MSNIINIDDNNFNQYISGDKVTLVDFFAVWCGPCKMLHPILEEVANECSSFANICQLDVDQAEKTAIECGISVVPSLFFYKNGKKVEQIVGYTSKDKIIEILKKY